MSTDPRPLTRSELAEFLPTQRAIRAFENLFRQANVLPPDDITVLLQEVTLAAGLSDTKAQQAIDALNRLTAAIEALESLPPHV